MDRSESEVMRLMQQIRDLQKTVNVLHDSEEFKDPETCQPVRCRDKTLTCASNNNHVSEAKSAGRISHKPHDFGTTISRNFVTPLSWDPVSPILNNASVQLGKAKPVFGASANSFSKVRVETPPVTPTPASTAAAFQAAAPLLMPNEISSKTRGFDLSAASFQEHAKHNIATTDGNTALFYTRISKDESLRSSFRSSFYEKGRNWNSKSFPHLQQRSVSRRRISEQKFVLVLVLDSRN